MKKSYKGAISKQFTVTRCALSVGTKNNGRGSIEFDAKSNIGLGMGGDSGRSVEMFERNAALIKSSILFCSSFLHNVAQHGVSEEFG